MFNAESFALLAMALIEQQLPTERGDCEGNVLWVPAGGACLFEKPGK
jgi:hypothetical protein